MTFPTALAVRGWLLASSPVQQLEATRNLILKSSTSLQAMRPGTWTCADLVEEHHPVGPIRSLISVMAQAGDVVVDLIPGSQGQSSPSTDVGQAVVAVAIPAGVMLILDGRCWFRVAEADLARSQLRMWGRSADDLARTDVPGFHTRKNTSDSAPVYQLRTRGFTMLPGALPPDRLHLLQQSLDALLAEDEAAWGVAALEALGQRGALRNLCDYGLPFQELLADSPVYTLVDSILGNGYILHSFDGLVLLPGEGRFPWDFHTDVMDLCGVAFPANRSPGVNCLYYLDDVTAENGATWLVPASHRMLMTVPAPVELADLSIQAVGRAGDALLFDARLWHCAGENRSARPRRLIKTLFCGPWLRPQMDYARAIRPDVLSALPESARQRIASSVPASVCELRQQFRKRMPS